MTLRRRLVTVAVVVGALVTLTACGAPAAPAPTDTEPEDSPLRQYLAALLGFERSDAERAAEDVRIEELMAACMAAEGFDYIPVSRDDPFYQPDEWRPDDASWVAEWGYGAVSFPGSDQMHAAQAEGDANTAYYESLSPAEQAAYSDTLYGPAPTDEELAASVDGSAPISWEEQGCWGSSGHEVRGDQPLDDAEHTVLRQAIQVFQETQFNAPEYAELNSEWAECMAAAGHAGFDRPEASRAAVYDAMSEIFASQTETDMDDPRMLALHDEEVERALADLDCRTQTDFRARSWAIQVAQEEQFIADHRAEFDELEAAAAQGD